MKYISQIKIITTVIFFMLLGASSVQAAEISIKANKSEIKSNEQFLVDITIHSKESINAIEGRLIFPVDKLLIKEIRDGNSVINFWVERPHVESSGIILFSGITPGGFSGLNNTIFSVVFEAKNVGIAYIALQATKALLNNGLGTETTLSIRDTTVSIKPGDSNARQKKLVDTELPENFTPIIVSDSMLFDGKNVLIFATQDKASGIDHYEVREGTWSWFKVAESPYLLKNQSLNKNIFVKAIDKAGKERIVKISPRNTLLWYENYENWIIIIIGVLVALFTTKKLWLKKDI
jgi:hypothetical protein